MASITDTQADLEYIDGKIQAGDMIYLIKDVSVPFKFLFKRKNKLVFENLANNNLIEYRHDEFEKVVEKADKISVK